MKSREDETPKVPKDEDFQVPKKVHDEGANLIKKTLDLLFIFDGTANQAALLKQSAPLFEGKFSDPSILSVKTENLPGEIVRVKGQCIYRTETGVFEKITEDKRIADPDHYDESFASLEERILSGEVKGSVVYVGDGGADGVNVPTQGETERLIAVANKMGVSIYFIYLDDAESDRKQCDKLLSRYEDVRKLVEKGELEDKDNPDNKSSLTKEAFDSYLERMGNVNPDPSNPNHRKGKYGRLCEQTGGAMFELSWPTDEATLEQAMLELQELVRTPASYRKEKIAEMQLKKAGAGAPDTRTQEEGAAEGEEGEVLERKTVVESTTVPVKVRRTVVQEAESGERGPIKALMPLLNGPTLDWEFAGLPGLGKKGAETTRKNYSSYVLELAKYLQGQFGTRAPEDEATMRKALAALQTRIWSKCEYSARGAELLTSTFNPETYNSGRPPLDCDLNAFILAETLHQAWGMKSDMAYVMVRLSDLQGNAVSGERALTQHMLLRTSLPDGKPVFVETMPPKYARQMTYSQAEFDKEYSLNRGLYFIEPVDGRVGITTYSGMASVYVRLGQGSGMTREILDQCTSWLSEVLRINPDDSGARLLRAVLLQQAGLAQDAREDYLHFIGLMGQYIQNEPGNDALYVMRGKAYLSIGERDKGMADLHKAQALNPRITIQE